MYNFNECRNVKPEENKISKKNLNVYRTLKNIQTHTHTQKIQTKSFEK
jgi:hypothetical protein